VDIQQSPELGRQPETLVLAWARDRVTGQPVYIGELDARRNGLACGCECPACQRPVAAVNAGKVLGSFKRRPHFRHPAGTVKASCEVLIARMAALRTLDAGGVITLPGRRWTGRRFGFGGQAHEVWVEEPPERIRVQRFSMLDRTTALLRLDDGRELEVTLLGALEEAPPEVVDGQLKQDNAAQGESTLRARVAVVVDDPGVAGLSPQELRSRLTLLTDAFCWRRHWKDGELARQAASEADALAFSAFDFLPSDGPERLEVPPDLPRELLRETLLHLEVKRILASCLRLYAPADSITEELNCDEGEPLRKSWSWPSRWLNLADVRLERTLGRLVPDVTCIAVAVAPGGADAEVAAFRPLLIEVTVTNTIDGARLARIQDTGYAALEIDLGRAAGEVDRKTLKRLVVEELGLKRWLVLPAREVAREALRAELAQERDGIMMRRQAAERARVQASSVPALASESVVSRSDNREAIERRLRGRLAELERQAADMPHWSFEKVSAVYKDVVGKLSYAAKPVSKWRRAQFDPWGTAEQQMLEAELKAVVEELKRRGFEDAGRYDMVSPEGIVVALMSIQRGFPFGHLNSSVSTMIHRLRKKNPAHQATIYLIALNKWKPALGEQEQAGVAAWGKQVWSSIQSGETHYLRPTVHDALLSALFPDLAFGLADERLWC